ncbi:MAG: Rrf2 family transcriptional regulator [Roseburia sp.]|nr:Rrf2 family transcriptional regulator [Roseburia sp.]
MISTKGRYALSIMLDISECDEEHPVSLKTVAKRQELSEKYLEQIASTLKKSGLLGSSRGMGGGYFLTREAKDISVGEILRVMEGDLAPAPCVERNASQCKRKDICTNVILWRKLNEAINAVIDNITLADMHQWKQGNQ